MSFDVLTLWLEQFQLLRPWALWLLLPACVLYALSVLSRHRASPWRALMKPEFVSLLEIEPRQVSWFNPSSLSLLCSIVWIFAIAGPSVRMQASELSQDEQSLVIVLQLNEAMLEASGEQTSQQAALEMAKLKILDLLQQQQTASVALLTYAGSSHTVLPLTKDHQAIKSYLLDLHPRLMPMEGNQPQQALPMALSLLAPSLKKGAAASERSIATGSIIYIGLGLSDDDALSLQSVPSAVAKILWRFSDGSNTEGDFFSANNFTLVEHSVDDEDVDRLQWLLSRTWAASNESENVKAQDDGYYLVFPLLLLMLLWFRRGMVLSWS